MTVDNVPLNRARLTVSKLLAELSPSLRSLSLDLHEHPETGYNEIHAHAVITALLKTHGVTVSASKSGLKTAFIATADPEGSLKRNEYIHIGFCSEYDALPMGHACGHNLIAISGVAAFLVARQVALDHGFKVKLTLLGTPAEETLGGKIPMIEAGDFADLDVCMMLHPGNADLTYGTYLACQGFTVDYHGKESHASGEPWLGLNALDAALNAYNAIALLRQQILPTDRIHGIITNGGSAPNIIPAYTSMTFLARSTHIQHLKSNLLPRVLNCMASAATSTGCTHKVDLRAPYFDLLTNSHLTSVYQQELESHVLPDEGLPVNTKLPSRIEQESVSRGSTDMGNVSHYVPSIHNIMNIGCKEEIHTIAFMEQAKTMDAHQRTLRRVQCLVMTALIVATNPQLLKDVKEEFNREKLQDN